MSYTELASTSCSAANQGFPLPVLGSVCEFRLSHRRFFAFCLLAGFLCTYCSFTHVFLALANLSHEIQRYPAWLYFGVCSTQNLPYLVYIFCDMLFGLSFLASCIAWSLCLGNSKSQYPALHFSSSKCVAPSLFDLGHLSFFLLPCQAMPIALFLSFGVSSFVTFLFLGLRYPRVLRGCARRLTSSVNTMDTQSKWLGTPYTTLHSSQCPYHSKSVTIKW